MLSQKKTEPKKKEKSWMKKVFKKRQTDEYFLIETNNMALCLIGKEIVSVCKDYNVKRQAKTC